MRRQRSKFFIATFAALSGLFLAPAPAQEADDSLKVYAANVVKTTPFQRPSVGEGIYLGHGAVLTASHVIGRWGFLKDPHVLIAGQNLPARIVKEGSLDTVDLTLLSVDETRLPVSLRSLRNPLCKHLPQVGDRVIVVSATQMMRLEISSPLLISARFRPRYDTLISAPAVSGSGVFDDSKRCLLGIVSSRIRKYDEGDQETADSFVGYFVSATLIADFIPPEFRF